MTRAVVVGAGVTGLAAALELTRRGWEVDVLEAADGPGGLLRPHTFRGVPCDLGSHRLHPSALQEPLIAELADEIGLVRRPRRGQIVLRGRHIPYPLTLPGLLRGLGVRTSVAFLRSWVGRGAPSLATWEADRAARPADGDDDEGFAAFVTARVGAAAYDGFYRPYAEKVWGVDPADLSRTIAKKRVSSARPGQQLVSGVLPRRLRGGTYLYPQRGMGALVAGLLRRCERAGVTIEYGAVATAPADLDADAVVYTAPLPQARPPDDPAHRGLYLLFLALDTPSLGDVDTWYVPEAGSWFGRVSEVRNFSSSLSAPGETVICVEIPEGRWGPGQDFAARADEVLEQLRSARIVGREVELLESSQRWLPAVYPMYTRGWLGPWREAVTRTSAGGRVFPAGRQGLFLHCNIDHCVSIASDAARHIADGRSSAAWAAAADRYLGLRVRD